LKPFTSAQVLDKILTVLGVEYELAVVPQQDGTDVNTALDHNEINHVEMTPEIVALRRFTGDDANAMTQVIHSFIENGVLNIKDLNACLHNGKDREMGELAHKMLTPFSQLGDNPVVPILIKLEKLINEELVYEEKQSLVDSLNTESAVIFEVLKKALV
jgi:hypothetical protein